MKTSKTISSTKQHFSKVNEHVTCHVIIIQNRTYTINVLFNFFSFQRGVSDVFDSQCLLVQTLITMQRKVGLIRGMCQNDPRILANPVISKVKN